jgi:hypothetical protein
LDETAWLQGMADRHGLPHGIVAYADLASPDVAVLLEVHLACASVRGIRQTLNWSDTPPIHIAGQAGLMSENTWRRGAIQSRGLFWRYNRNGDRGQAVIMKPMLTNLAECCQNFICSRVYNREQRIVLRSTGCFMFGFDAFFTVFAIAILPATFSVFWVSFVSSFWPLLLAFGFALTLVHGTIRAVSRTGRAMQRQGTEAAKHRRQ